MKEIIESYKRELEILLATMSIFKSDKKNKIDEKIFKQNYDFLKNKFIKMKSNNVDEDALDIALKELIPYLTNFN